MPFHATAFELVRNNCEASIPPCNIRDALERQYDKFVRAGLANNDEEDTRRDEAALRRLAAAVRLSQSAFQQHGDPSIWGGGGGGGGSITSERWDVRKCVANFTSPVVVISFITLVSQYPLI